MAITFATVIEIGQILHAFGVEKYFKCNAYMQVDKYL